MSEASQKRVGLVYSHNLNSRHFHLLSVVAFPIIVVFPVGTDILNLGNVGLKVSHRRAHVQIYAQLHQSRPGNVVGSSEGGGDQVRGGKGEIIALESSDTGVASEASYV